MRKIYEINENDKEYPKKLFKIQKRPSKLYVMGNVKILNNKCIAMVGSRDSTPYGEYYASTFAKALSKSGITIVSRFSNRDRYRMPWKFYAWKRKNNSSFRSWL